jgi:hypothetical protein
MALCLYGYNFHYIRGVPHCSGYWFVSKAGCVYVDLAESICRHNGLTAVVATRTSGLVCERVAMMSFADRCAHI